LKADLQHERVRELAPTTVDMFEVKLIETKVIVADGFTGPGVAVPSEEGKNAARLFASLEEVYCWIRCIRVKRPVHYFTT